MGVQEDTSNTIFFSKNFGTSLLWRILVLSL